MALSFANDIRPMFRDDPDVETMKAFGMDLSAYEDVKTHSAAIYRAVEDGSMPCDEPWPKERVARFREWMEEGMMP